MKRWKDKNENQYSKGIYREIEGSLRMRIDIIKNQGQSMKMRAPRRMRICIYSVRKRFRD
jgi:hypothetical protein